MRKIFYLSFFLFATVNLFAQSPGGVSGSVLWLKANDGASSSAWIDKSALLNDFAQGVPANQPALLSNTFNFNPALQFNAAANTLMTRAVLNGFPINDDDRTIFIVANATATDNYRWIFVYGSPGNLSQTCQFGNHDMGGLTTAFYGSELNSPGYWTAPVNANGALADFTLASSLVTQYDRSNQIQSGLFGGLSATAINGTVGALNASGTEPWSGSIAEIIVFDSALSDPKRQQVEAYLALKYGFTLGAPANPINYVSSASTIFWNSSNPNFPNDVFGIGTDAGSGLTQTSSNSMNSGNGDGTGQSVKGNLVLSVSTALTDGQFLMIANDGGDFTETTMTTGPAIAIGSQRISRNWQVQNTGSVGAVDLSFDTNGFTFAGGTNPVNYRLMIDVDGDGDYTTGTPIFVTPSSITGNLITFPGITLNNTDVFTLITQASAALLPAIWESFNVTLQKNKAILVWKTSDEINVDHYTIESSTDGNSFNAAGTVTAKNGSGTNTYTFVQENLPAGTRYYHIKRFDKDGKFQLSDVKSVHVGGLNTVLLKSNPVTKGKLELNIDVQQNQNAIIRIVNTSGIIMHQQQTGLSGGTNSLTTDISAMAKGTYFLQVQLGKEIINKKFVKI
jgi:hypothetical protein